MMGQTIAKLWYDPEKTESQPLDYETIKCYLFGALV